MVAGAGSGKTRVLTTRIAWLLAEHGLHPGELVAFTFTNKAAREMRARVDDLVGPGGAPRWIGTFHATGVRILRADGEQIGIDPSFAIYDSDDTLRLIRQVLNQRNIDPKQFPPTAVRAAISRWKNDDIAPAAAKQAATTFVDERNADAYDGYETGLRSCNALDFDDLVLRTVHVLEQIDEVRRKYAGRFRHVLVDEFQDTNSLQLILIKLLTAEHGNVFAVGDDDQAIYGWRGACVENMLSFDEYFPGTVVYRLEQNYRSSGNILAAANAVIAHNRRRRGKNLWTADEPGDRLRLEQFDDAEDEAAGVVAIVREVSAAGGRRGDVTVLYRTNAQSRLLEEALRRADVTHQLVGSVHFYERREVRDLLAYLKLVANPADQVSWQRVVNVPRRRIGDTTVRRLLAIAGREELTPGEAAARPRLLEESLGPAACKRERALCDQVTRWRMDADELGPARLFERIVADVDYGRFLEADDPTTARSRGENVAELVNAVYSFVEGAPDAGLAEFLEQVALVSDPDTIADGDGAVRLMTIHTAKGLEFPVVVITGCEDDLLPHATSAVEQDGLEEERRLFYVALTRAERRVHLLYASRRRRFGSYADSLVSRFLREIPFELVAECYATPPPRRPLADLLFGPSGTGDRGGAMAAVRRTRHLPRRAGPVKGPPPLPDDGTATGDGWQTDLNQDAPFYEGQLVAHATFGAGVVARVEGRGKELSVTVDFQEAGRKHIYPRYAPLVPID